MKTKSTTNSFVDKEIHFGAVVHLSSCSVYITKCANYSFECLSDIS